MLRRWAQLQRRPKILLIAGGGIGLALALGVAIAVIALASGGNTQASIDPTATPSPTATSTPTSTPTATPTATPTPIVHTAIFDGVLMTDEEWQARKDLPPIIVMVDNNPAAFPQTGLDKADLVYEAFVEGQVTRFMALYWRREAEYIEPVRSVRTPFLIWAIELDALIAHAGSSASGTIANAQAQIYEWGLRSLNAFWAASSGAYYRDGNRYAPYNLVTSTVALRNVATALGWVGGPAVEPWLFKEDGEGTASAPTIAGLEVNFRDRRVAAEVIQWHWDEQSKTYLRFQTGGADIDGSTGEQLRFKNVVVMTVPWWVASEVGHVLLDQLGEGPAQVFLDGKMIQATWRKADARSRTRFYDSAGNEIAFNRGSTFVEVVGPASLIQTAETVAGLPAIPPYQPPR